MREDDAPAKGLQEGGRTHGRYRPHDGYAAYEYEYGYGDAYEYEYGVA
eukprot:gene9314-5040_t